VLGHHHVTHHHEAIAPLRFFQDMQERVATLRRPTTFGGGSKSRSESGDYVQADDQFLHTHSEQLRKATKRLERDRDRHRITQFMDFIRREDSATLTIIGAIFATGNHVDAVRFLCMTEARFNRKHTHVPRSHYAARGIFRFPWILLLHAWFGICSSCKD
jgi:hypothetical protein